MIKEFVYPHPVENEEWLEIRGFPHYLISSWGRVYSVKADRLLQPRPSSWGYLQVCLYKSGERTWPYVHRLVAEHFIPGEDVGLEVNHLDGDKTYNNERNLEWVTKRMNNQHAYDTGLNKGRGIPIQVVETGDIYESITACSNAIGMTVPSIRYALRYGTKTRKGLSFRYVD